MHVRMSNMYFLVVLFTKIFTDEHWILISSDVKFLEGFTFIFVVSRRPGQSRITTPRKETDTCRIYSGVAEG